MSANLCEALATLTGRSTGTILDVGVRFALARLPARPPIARFAFSGDLSETLTEAARNMRATEPVEAFELRGVVRSLSSVQPSDGGTIKVLAPVDDKLRLVEVALDEAAYAQAMQAHTNQRLFVCEGELGRHHNSWKLSNPRRVGTEADEG